MKRIAIIAIVGIVVIGLGYLVSQHESTLEVNNVASINKIVEKEIVEVSTLNKRIETAQSAAEQEIEASAQKAYRQAYDQAMLEIELAETSLFRSEIEDREKTLQANSKAY